MAGRPRKPTNVLALNGAFKHNPKRAVEREAEPEPFGEVGDPPEEFNEEQKKQYRELVRLAHKGVLCASDGPVLQMGAILMARLMAKPDEFTPGEFGRLHAILGALGMTPADRSKVKVIKSPTKTADPLDEFAAAS